MSNTPIPPLNPYATSYGNYSLPVQPVVRMPTFCLGMCILSLVFCVLRIPLVVLGTINWLSVQPQVVDDAILITAPFEVLTGSAIVFFGLPANIGMLLQRRWGVTLGFVTATASVLSTLVAVCQLAILFRANISDEVRLGIAIGALLTLVLRGTIIGLYFVAVTKMQKYLRLKQLEQGDFEISIR